MSDPRADVALLVDFTDLCQSLAPEPEPDAPAGNAPESASGPGEPAGERETDRGESPGDGHPVLPPDQAARIVAALRRYSGQVGRVAIARAYADWSRCSVLAHEVGVAQLEPVLVPATAEGEDRSHIRLVADALEALYTGDEPDAFVLVTGDPTLLPLVQKIRADGSEVLVVAPEGAIGEELRRAADRFVPLERVLEGEEARPARPRAWRSGRAEGEGRGRGATRGADARRERPPHPTPVSSVEDFVGYDWGPFVKLIDELEHRLPFVGVRYLVNKVLGMHNCGVEDPRLKRDLINRAVDDGLIEMYPVGNVGDRADPVTACRLDRVSEAVVTVLGRTETPEGPPEHERGEGLDDAELEHEATGVEGI